MKCKACGSEDFVVDERMENPWESVQDVGCHACKPAPVAYGLLEDEYRQQ